MGSLLSTLLAHQGGWDEVLLIAGPILVIAGLLVLAKKRVDAAHGAAPHDSGSPADAPGGTQAG